MRKEPVTKFFERKQLALRLSDAREKAGLTRDEVVEQSKNGFARSSLQAWESGEREPKLENIYQLSIIYGIHPWSLIAGEEIVKEKTASNEDDYFYIPAYNIAVSAGHGMFNDDTLKPHKHLAFRRDWVSKRGLIPKCLAVLFNDGDSMEPTIPDSSAMVINREQDKILDGNVYVIRIDDRLYVKRTQWIPTGGIRLISDNKAYDSFDITKEDMLASDIEVCGQVIHVSHDIA